MSEFATSGGCRMQAPPATEGALWWILLRILALQGIGSMLLLLAGLPTAGSWMGWLGAVLVIGVLSVASWFVLRIPGPVRPAVARLLLLRPLLGVSVVLAGIGYLLLVVWLIGFVFAPRSVQSLALVALFSAVAAVVALLGRALMRRRQRKT